MSNLDQSILLDMVQTSLVIEFSNSLACDSSHLLVGVNNFLGQTL